MNDVTFYANLADPNGPTKLHAYLTLKPGTNVYLFHEDATPPDVGGSPGKYSYSGTSSTRIDGQFGVGIAFPSASKYEKIGCETVPAATSDPNYSSCVGAACYGDAKVSGTLAGQLTIAAQNDIIIIIGNTQYGTFPGGTDVLGLVANNDVIINHPVNSSGVNQAGSLTNPRVDAAILALDPSFYVQNTGIAARRSATSPRTVSSRKSSVARSARSSGNPPVIRTGYNKDYTYDTRLKYLSPPYFLSPTLSAWQRISYSEITPTATP